MPPLPKTRRLAESYVELDLMFSQDEKLRETYVGGLSQVRMGRLMEGAFSSSLSGVMVLTGPT